MESGIVSTFMAITSAVPIHGISASEIVADGWGDAEAEPGDGGDKGREEDPMVSCSMDAQDGEQGDNGAEEEHCGMDVDGEDGTIGGDKVEEDETSGGDEVEEDVTVGSYKDNGEEHASDKDGGEENANASDRDEEDDGSSYNGSFLDENYEEDEHDFDDGVVEEEEEGPPPPEKKSLNDLYRKPWDLMYRGNFHGAKVQAARKDQFLLVNLQKRTDFASQLQNRDLWSHEVVKQAVGDNFVFLLLEKVDGYHADYDECSKVCTFYRLELNQLPALLVLDPVTGQMRAMMCGAIEPDNLMLFISEHTESKPSELPHLKIIHRTATMPEGSASVGAGGEQEPAEPDSSASAGADAAAVEQEPAAPENSAPAGVCGAQEPDAREPEPVPMDEPTVEVVDSDEPMEGEQMYKLRLRFPGGNVVAKEFGCKRRVAVLFEFCSSVVHGGGETEKKAFRILRFAGRAMEEIKEDGATFEDLGLNCATVSVVFDS